jgi:hypothetical protein
MASSRARDRFVGEDEAGCLGLEPANELIDVALLGADGADEGDSLAPVLGRVGDGDGVLMDIEADEKCHNGSWLTSWLNV